MRLAGLIIGIVFILLGLLWTLQGSNVLPGSAMSGLSQWLYAGIVLLIAGFALLIWTARQRA